MSLKKIIVLGLVVLLVVSTGVVQAIAYQARVLVDSPTIPKTVSYSFKQVGTTKDHYVFSNDGFVYFTKPDGSLLKFAVPSENGDGRLRVAVDDLDADGKTEYIIGFGNKIYVYHEDGQLLPNWPQTLDTPISSIYVYDSANSGKQIVVVPSYWERKISLPKVLFYNYNAENIATLPIFSNHEDLSLGFNREARISEVGEISTAAFADVNQDGSKDLVLIEGIYQPDLAAIVGNPYKGTANILVLDLKNKRGLDGWTAPSIDLSVRSSGLYLGYSPVVANLGDGVSILVASPNKAEIHLYNQYGVETSNIRITPRVASLVSFLSDNLIVTDLENDGKPEVIVALYEINPYSYDYFTSLHVFEKDSSGIHYKAGWPYIAEEADGISYPQAYVGEASVIDLDNDGKEEILVSSFTYNSSDGGARRLKAYALNSNGTLKNDFQLIGQEQIRSYGYLSAPAIGDFDGDDSLEVAVGTDMFDLSVPKTARHDWPALGGANNDFTNIPDTSAIKYADLGVTTKYADITNLAAGETVMLSLSAKNYPSQMPNGVNSSAYAVVVEVPMLTDSFTYSSYDPDCVLNLTTKIATCNFYRLDSGAIRTKNIKLTLKDHQLTSPRSLPLGTATISSKSILPKQITIDPVSTNDSMMIGTITELPLVNLFVSAATDKTSYVASNAANNIVALNVKVTNVREFSSIFARLHPELNTSIKTYANAYNVSFTMPIPNEWSLAEALGPLCTQATKNSIKYITCRMNSIVSSTPNADKEQVLKFKVASSSVNPVPVIIGPIVASSNPIVSGQMAREANSVDNTTSISVTVRK